MPRHRKPSPVRYRSDDLSMRGGHPALWVLALPGLLLGWLWGLLRGWLKRR